MVPTVPGTRGDNPENRPVAIHLTIQFFTDRYYLNTLRIMEKYFTI